MKVDNLWSIVYDILVIYAELVVSNSIQGNKIGAICGQPCHRTNRQQGSEGIDRPNALYSTKLNLPYMDGDNK